MRLKQGALCKLLPHHAHYVSCILLLLYVSNLLVKFVVAEICFLLFHLQLRNILSAYVVLGVKVLINIFFFRRENLKYEGFLIIP